MAVTLKDVARRAGVSHTTVSRALRNHDAISKRTIKRIKELAAEMGYIPSHVARGLKTNRSHAIGVIVPHINHPFCAAFVQGVHDVLHGAGYALLLSTYQHLNAELDELLVRLIGRQVDGFIMCIEGGITASLDSVESSEIPHIIVYQKANVTRAPYTLGQQQATELIERLHNSVYSTS